MDERLNEQLLEAPVDVPIDVPDVVSGMVLTIVRELDAHAGTRGDVKAGQAPSEPALGHELQAPEAAQEDFVE